MKRKLLMTLLALTLALCSIFGLTACGGNNDNDNNIGGGNSTIAVTSVTLNRSSLNLEIGDTVSLYETIYPSNATDKSVTWSSSNTSVATVSNGIVTALSAGETTITVITNNNITATCEVVVNNPIVLATDITLDKTSATIEVGDTLSLSATISPNNATDKNIIWSSSNASVATVSNGIVTAVSTGTVVVTAKTNNNLTATCEITVVPKQILPTTIYLSKTLISLEEGKELNIVATILPTNATNKAIDWLVLDTSVARVDNGKITAVAEGETMLIVTTANGLTATCSIVVTSPFVFELVGGSYALKSYNGTATEVVVPSSYKGKPVTAIGVPQEGVNPNATGFAYSTIVKKIVLPDTINTLSWGAFYQCQSLEEVNIPNGVKSIGFYLFYGCSSLKKLSVSLDHFTMFKKYFAKTKNNDGSIEYLAIPSSLKTVVVTGTKVGSSAFGGCSPLEEVIILDSVTNIGSYAFYNCDSLTSIIIPSSVTSIGGWAFSGCSALTKVNYTGTIDQWVQISFDDTASNPICYAKKLYINDELVTEAKITTATKINNSAFRGCDSLTSVTIGDSVTSIGEIAFAGCDSLTSIEIPDSVTSIGEWAFEGCDSLTSIEIPDSVTSIGSEAFYNCSSLTSIVIPDSVTSIGSEAFSGCYSLTSVVIGDSVTSIGYRAFYNCSSLTSIVIPDSVTSIGSEAFYNCSSLTSIVIPNSVTSIGSEAFSWCRSLITIKYRGTQAQWGNISKGDDWNLKTGEYTITCNYTGE